MSTSGTVIELYRDVIGKTPRELVASERRLGADNLRELLDAHETNEYAEVKPTRYGEIWPLVSHHTYNSRALFGSGANIRRRALVLLLIHDGLVVADPLKSVKAVWDAGRTADAVRAANVATIEIAEIEPLIAHHVVRLTKSRPSLKEENRLALLKSMGLDDRMSYVTSFLEKGASTQSMSADWSRFYVLEGRRFCAKFGVYLPPTINPDAISREVNRLAATILEVTWQFAVASKDAWCDVSVRGGLEEHIARGIIDGGYDLAGGVESRGHFSRLELSGVPNLDPHRLSIDDALAIRSHGSFEAFRTTVRRGLNGFDASLRSGVDEELAAADFRDLMLDEANRFRDQVKPASFRERIADEAIPLAVGVILGFTPLQEGPAKAALVSVGTSAASVVSSWLHSRSSVMKQDIAVRHLSMLGGNMA